MNFNTVTRMFFDGIRTISYFAAIAALMVLLSPRQAYAQGYPYPVYPVYREYNPLPPNGAALGPWPMNFEVGGGPTSVIGGTGNNLNGGGNFTVGGGYNFTPRTGFVLEFGNSWLGVPRAIIQGNNAVSADASVWSLTLNPVWRYRIAGPLGGYIIGGGGFYQRNLRFTTPANMNGFFPRRLEDNYQTDGTGGVNIGMGLTCNLGWGTKLFVEARYHYILTSDYATQILPVTVGLRW